MTSKWQSTRKVQADIAGERTYHAVRRFCGGSVRLRILLHCLNRSANLEMGQLFESTVKRITEVTYSKDIIIDNVIVINIDNVVNTAHFENFLQR